MLTVNRLSKRFGKVQAVKDVSFHVKKGSTFAFLGTNGAGKSTVIHILIDLLKPDDGEITFADGYFQQVTGVVFQNHRLDEALSIEENLMIRAKLYGMHQNDAAKKIDELLELTDLSNMRQRLYGDCSGGEKRKADIIRSLLHQPRLLILDEPTTGLDAESREEIWLFLQQLQVDHDLTIFLTTHYIEEVENVDYVVIMHEGEIEVEGTPEELRSTYSKIHLKLHPVDMGAFLTILHEKQYSFEQDEQTVFIPLDSSKQAIPILQEFEPDIHSFSIEEASLENVFLHVTEHVKGKVSI